MPDLFYELKEDLCLHFVNWECQNIKHHNCPYRKYGSGTMSS